MFWDNLSNFDKRDGNPWLVIGDLNVNTWRHEKDGGNGQNPSKWRFLLEFMDNDYLLDLGFHGKAYTWER